MLQELVKVVGICELRYLHLDLAQYVEAVRPDELEFSESFWLDTFAACPLLASIEAEKYSGISLCPVLAAVTLDGVVWERSDIQDDHQTPTGVLVWPALRVVSLPDVPMRHVYENGRSLHKVLAQSLRDRKALECPVHTLDLDSEGPRWRSRFEDMNIVENVTGRNQVDPVNSNSEFFDALEDEDDSDEGDSDEDDSYEDDSDEAASY
ncbi:hypothetical protein FA95DRAFT_1609461 [Auriscalpium vulgare]|uniref:Uncharacterized protein n=1 Tax=Auriscalpium vulgare TaxID=40419 RepID=A0ACB8RIJ3_9AGAM|nr:hypothetical protein FA95DRAFT_1609461 [Auriscalpium vulgare]